MADLELRVVIKDINKAKASTAIMRKIGMPQIDDPANPGETIDEYPTVKARVEAFLADHALRAINAGIDLLAQDLGEKLTSDIFIKD